MALVKELLTHLSTAFFMASFSNTFQTSVVWTFLSLMSQAAFVQVVLTHDLGQCVLLIILCSLCGAVGELCVFYLRAMSVYAAQIKLNFIEMMGMIFV